jgi:hypothetical protein
MTTVDGPLERLEALLSRLEAAAFERASSQQLLIDAVRHQLADGQVETLLALERSVAAVRAGTERLATAADTPATALTEAAQMLAVAVEQAVQTARLQLATEADAAVGRVQQSISADESSLGQAVVEAAGELNAHVEAALDAQRRIAETATHVAEAVHAAGSQAVADLQAASEQHVRSMQQQAADFAAHATGFTTALETLLERWEKRDARRDARVETRLEALVQRVDASLQAAQQQLAARDAHLEAQRADEFARVLTDILSRAGTSPRRLRGRVKQVLDDERESRPVPAQPEPPPVAKPRRRATKKDEESA